MAFAAICKGLCERLRVEHTPATYQVQGRSSLEPLDLSLVEGVGQGDLILGTTLVLSDQSQVDTRGKGLETFNGNLVGWLDLVVVGGVDECQCEHSLFLQVGLMDTSERTSDDGQSTKEAGLQSGVFTRGTFTVVVVTDDDPLDTLVTVVRCSLRDSSPYTGDLVLDLIRLAVLDVDGTNQAILRDVLEMTTVLEPRSTSGDMISRYRTGQY